MSDKNIELMKKIIEEKRKKCSQQGSVGRAAKNIGNGTSKGFKNNKGGGLFDK